MAAPPSDLARDLQTPGSGLAEPPKSLRRRFLDALTRFLVWLFFLGGLFGASFFGGLWLARRL
jgi:hypothetical protein